MLSKVRLKRAAVRLWEKMSPPFAVDMGGKHMVVPHPQRALSEFWEWQPNWKTALIGSILSARPGLFIDVGANVGQTLLDYSSAANRAGYLAFEPNPLCVSHLTAVIERNGLEDCRVIPTGLSDRSGVAELLIEHDLEADPTATIMGDLRPGRTYRSRYICCMRFDDVIGTLTDGPLGLIKIDIEGAELFAMRGMMDTLRNRKPWILCEVLRRDAAEPIERYRERSDELLALLISSGYDIHNVRKADELKRVVGFERIHRFPEEPFSTENREDNDYLFTPAGTLHGATLLQGSTAHNP